MTRIAWLLIFGFALCGCGADNEDTSSTVQEDSDDSDWDEEYEDVIETGSFSVNLPGDHGSGKAACSINLTRIVEDRVASIILTLDVVGKGCDGMGHCDNPDMQGGEFTFSGGIEGDKPFATMILNYEPPGDSDEEPMWMYNVIFNETPFSRFEMSVDDKPFNVLTSDTRGAEDLSTGPHLWDTKIDIEIDMLRVSDEDDQSTPGLQTRGEFSYEGPCEVYAKYMGP